MGSQSYVHSRLDLVVLTSTVSACVSSCLVHSLIPLLGGRERRQSVERRNI